MSEFEQSVRLMARMHTLQAEVDAQRRAIAMLVNRYGRGNEDGGHTVKFSRRELTEANPMPSLTTATQPDGTVWISTP